MAANETKDRLDIAETLARLMRCLDTGDRETFADCWAEQLDFEAITFDGKSMKASSRDEMVAISSRGLNGQPSPLRHLVGNVEVDFADADTADVKSYSLYINVGAEAGLGGMGEYRDRLTRGADGRWRVVHRRHLFLTPLKH